MINKRPTLRRVLGLGINTRVGGCYCPLADPLGPVLGSMLIPTLVLIYPTFGCSLIFTYAHERVSTAVSWNLLHLHVTGAMG